ncbi:MAG: patatin-like phospholipase family protein [Eudoraea sp.]|uniref:patatin-like phospholipase family protein n=1 Tax=Eudoraea sp. TaxID=1979955 RepID=UPI0032654163
MKKDKKIGLSLSGGGYRATVYHLGTLRKLKELDLLQHIDVISTNSGGSITGALYGLYGQDFDKFEIFLLRGVKKSVIKQILMSRFFLIPALIIFLLLLSMVGLLFTGVSWIVLIMLIAIIIVILYFQFDLFPFSKIIQQAYDKFFFHGKTLSSIKDKVKLAINSTNAETGTLFTFSKQKMNDSSYRYPKDGGKPIYFDHDNFPISRAVAASTCVPFIFTPVKISQSFFTNKKDYERVKPRLVDGGVYDNQGVHKLAQKNSEYACDIIIVSDAGNSLPFKNTYKNVLPLLIRVSDIFMNRIKNFQMIHLIFNPNNLEEVAYQSLGWNIEKSIPAFIENIRKGNLSKAVVRSHGIKEEHIEARDWSKIESLLKQSIDYDLIISESNTEQELTIARGVSTNLKALTDVQINTLTKHAEVLTEIQIKLYCPTLFK